MEIRNLKFFLNKVSKEDCGFENFDDIDFTHDLNNQKDLDILNLNIRLKAHTEWSNEQIAGKDTQLSYYEKYLSADGDEEKLNVVKCITHFNFGSMGRISQLAIKIEQLEAEIIKLTNKN